MEDENMKPAGFIWLGGLTAVVGGETFNRAALGYLEVRKLNRERTP